MHVVLSLLIHYSVVKQHKYNFYCSTNSPNIGGGGGVSHIQEWIATESLALVNNKRIP